MFKMCKANQPCDLYQAYRKSILWTFIPVVLFCCFHAGIKVAGNEPLNDVIIELIPPIMLMIIYPMLIRYVDVWGKKTFMISWDVTAKIGMASVRWRKPLYATKAEWLKERDGDGDDPYLNLPEYHSEHASGFDMAYQGRAEIIGPTLEGTNLETHTFAKGTRLSIPTGWRFQIPRHFELQLRPRSSMLKRGIRIEMGTIDQDYTGEVHILAECIDDVQLNIGDRIAQLVLCTVGSAIIVPVREFIEDGAGRGSNGFGSTGQ